MKKVLMAMGLLLASIGANAQPVTQPTSVPRLAPVEEKQEEVAGIDALMKSLCQAGENEAKQVVEIGTKSGLQLRAFASSCFLLTPQVGRFDLLIYSPSEDGFVVSEIAFLVLFVDNKWQTVKAGKTIILDSKTLGFTFYPKEL